MIPLNLLKPIGKLSKALDVRGLVAGLDDIDVSAFTSTGSSDEKVAEGTKLAMLIFELILENLEEAAEPFVELVAAWKDIPIEEAEKLDLIATIKEMLADTGVLGFLS